MTYTITKNEAFRSVEIAFDSKPSEAIREALKALRFRWHSVKKVWYGYTTEEAVRAALGETTEEKTATKTSAPRKTEKVNKYGVKVGDIFSCSWGWEQTNVDFFQVVELVGECSVRVREVYPEIVEATPTCSMAEDRVYKLTSELLPPASRSIFIDDQERGDLKRLRSVSYRGDEYVCFTIGNDHRAYKRTGDTVTEYVSWYA